MADLIDWSTWHWDTELISNTFWPVDVHSILQVPFGSPETTDRLVWGFSKSGLFTVRSCYHLLISSKHGEEEEALDRCEGADSLWKWIWALQVPPKIRKFLWRACHEIIPTRTALVRRHVGSNPFCEFCKLKMETGAHLFFHCSYVTSIWMEEPFLLSQPIATPNFAMGLRKLKERLSKEVFLLACVVLWNVWYFRNGILHESEAGKRSTIVTRSKEYLDSYKSAIFTFPLPILALPVQSWQPPEAPFIKVNFDEDSRTPSHTR